MGIGTGVRNRDRERGGTASKAPIDGAAELLSSSVHGRLLSAPLKWGCKINCMLHKSLLGPSGKLKTKNSKSTIIITITSYGAKGMGAGKGGMWGAYVLSTCCQLLCSLHFPYLPPPPPPNMVFSTLLLGTHLTLATANPTQYTLKEKYIQTTFDAWNRNNK